MGYMAAKKHLNINPSHNIAETFINNGFKTSDGVKNPQGCGLYVSKDKIKLEKYEEMSFKLLVRPSKVIRVHHRIGKSLGGSQFLPTTRKIVQFSNMQGTFAIKPGALDKAHEKDSSYEETISKWAQDWQMQFNVPKCKVLHFGNSNPKNKYVMDGVELEAVEEEKDFGVITPLSSPYSL